MKILYIHQYFKTPEEGGAIRSYYLAKGLVDYGYQVELITSHNNNNYQIKNIEGIRVHYLPVFYKNELSYTSRIFSFLKFSYLAFFKAKDLKEVDICYATSTPLTVGFIALALKIFTKLPYIFEVRDLWPEAPIQMGAIKNRFLIKILKKLEKLIYNQAKDIVALSPAMKDCIVLLTPYKSISVIPNMADLDLFINSKEKNEFKNKNFRIIYFGAIGKVNHLNYLLEIAEASLENKKLEFYIIGEGAELNNMKTIATQKKLKNLSFLPHLNKFNLKEQLSQADAVYISFMNIEILKTSSPNKFFDGLAAGKMIILNFKGWLKDLVELHQCGIYADPLKPHQFLNNIEPFLKDKSLLLRYQQNALQLAEKHFSKEEQIKILVSIIEGKKNKSSSDSSAYILNS
ncbi:glycosyltransferase family 4 protein [soil metagenome]